MWVLRVWGRTSLVGAPGEGFMVEGFGTRAFKIGVKILEASSCLSVCLSNSYVVIMRRYRLNGMFEPPYFHQSMPHTAFRVQGPQAVRPGGAGRPVRKKFRRGFWAWSY